MTHFENVIKSPILCKANLRCYSVLFIFPYRANMPCIIYYNISISFNSNSNTIWNEINIFQSPFCQIAILSLPLFAKRCKNSLWNSFTTQKKRIKALIPFNIIHKAFLHMIHFVVEWLDSLLSDLITQCKKSAAAYLNALLIVIYL